jgi:hypothetical protein
MEKVLASDTLQDNPKMQFVANNARQSINFKTSPAAIFGLSAVAYALGVHQGLAEEEK